MKPRKTEQPRELKFPRAQKAHAGSIPASGTRSRHTAFSVIIVRDMLHHSAPVVKPSTNRACSNLDLILRGSADVSRSVARH